MKKTIVTILIFSAVILLVLTVFEGRSYSFFVGFGSPGAVNNVIKDGQTKGLIPTNTTPPSTLVATLISLSQVNLNWADNSTDETGFQIERRTAAGTYTVITTTATGATAYSNTGLAQQTTYTYRLRAITSGGLSKASNEDSSTTWTPAVPSALSAVATSSNSISLNWSDNSDNETGFYIERKDSGTYSSIATVGRNIKSYTNTGLFQNTSYTYKVMAYNIIGNSAYSAEASATTPKYTWVKQTVLSAPSATSKLAFGNARNDGTNRMYCGTTLSGAIEITYSSSSSTWVTTSATPLTVHGNGTTAWTSIINSVAIGNARLSAPNLYLACDAGGIASSSCEYVLYTPSAPVKWTSDRVDPTITGPHEDVGVWAARVGTDTKERVYLASDTQKIVEFEFTGTVPAVSATVCTGGHGISRAIDFADARNDGKKRIYAAGYDGRAYEFEWNTGTLAWVETTPPLPVCGTGNLLRDISVGDGRNDGKNRIYVASEDGHVYEYTYSAGVWQAPVDLLGNIATYNNAVMVGDATNDGSKNVFVGGNDNTVWEYIYNKTTLLWGKIQVGIATGKINDLKIFQGRYDGKNRLYATSDDFGVYEFTAQ